MESQPKQMACLACTDAKRRCDKSRPSCSRCIDRETVCVYPPTTKRRRQFRQSLQTISSEVGSHLFPEHGTPTTQDEFSSSPASFPAISSQLGSTATESTLSSTAVDWFLTPSMWTIVHKFQPPASFPSGRSMSNFISGQQAWLTRFLHKGHSPLIHRHLYCERTLPRCIQDAYSAISIGQVITRENEELINAISSSYISTLLNSQPAETPVCAERLSTRDHLARTQALLIHVLLGLFSTFIARRAEAENLIETLLSWTRQMWDSAAKDIHDSCFTRTPLPSAADDDDRISELHRAFVLSESIRRTWLLAHIATGVFLSLKASWSTCTGDIAITLRSGLWDASSPARWEALVSSRDPLFLRSLQGRELVTRGVPASEVDEFMRLLFTVMWGLEKVEDWVIRTGDKVSMIF